MSKMSQTVPCRSEDGLTCCKCGKTGEGVHGNYCNPRYPYGNATALHDQRIEEIRTLKRHVRPIEWMVDRIGDETVVYRSLGGCEEHHGRLR